jgi:hypothetical protein
MNVRLPKPENWHERPSLTALSFLFVFGATALGSWWSVVVLSRAEYATALVAFGFSAAFLCATLAITITKFGWVHARGVTDKNGTVVPIDRIVSALYSETAILIIPCGIAALVFGFMGKLDLPVSGDRSQAFLALLVGFAVIGGISMVGALFARGWLGHVCLMPSGFEISELRRTSEGSWDDVKDVSDKTSDRRAAQPIELVMNDGSTHVINGAATYSPHGVALYWMVRHYWLHPEDRAELTDGRAVERLRDEDFDTAS